MTNYFKDDEHQAEASTHEGSIVHEAGHERSIRNIALPQRKQMRRAPGEPTLRARQQRPSRRSSRMFMWVAAVLGIAVLAVGAFFVLQDHTTITLTPRTHTVVFDEQATYTLYPEGDVRANSLALTYKTETREFDESASVEATGSEKVEERASGKLTVVNNHSDKSLRLIANTRFETPSGLVYRIRESATIPGKSGTTPGTITLTVYADDVGDSYNIGPVERFTLPGLKTSAPEMFDSVYARSSAPMTGGFSGTRPVVSSVDRDAAQAQLRTRLEEQIQASLAGASTEEDIFLTDLADIRYESLSSVFEDDGTVSVRERAYVTVPVVATDAFAQHLARATSADADDGEVRIANPSTYTMTLVSEDVEIGSDAVDFTLSGKAQFIWSIDVNALAQDIAGKNKNAFQVILEGYPGVEEAQASVRPFWRGTFSSDPSNIDVVVASVE